MPFTFSHPAIVLPLARLSQRWFSLTGLVVGSLTPDFEYFLRMRVQSDHSHTVAGVLWFDLPLGVLLAFIFHNVARDPLFSNLPAFLRQRLSAYARFDWNAHFKANWIVVLISILVGAASHLFWDGFTHDHGCFVGAIPALANDVEVVGRPVPVFKLLQHSSTLIGGLVIAFAILKLPRDRSATGQPSARYWGILSGLALAIIAIRILGGLDPRLYGHLIATGISAVLMALILAPLLVRRKGWLASDP